MEASVAVDSWGELPTLSEAEWAQKIVPVSEDVADAVAEFRSGTIGVSEFVQRMEANRQIILASANFHTESFVDFQAFMEANFPDYDTGNQDASNALHTDAYPELTPTFGVLVQYTPGQDLTGPMASGLGRVVSMHTVERWLPAAFVDGNLAAGGASGWEREKMLKYIDSTYGPETE